VYSNLDEGVKGYFDFIQLPRYSNLKGITDPETYLKTIKSDGYATSSTYVQSNMNIVSQYGLTQYDKEVKSDMSYDRNAVVAKARSWLGKNEADGSHKSIIDIYNGHKPLARNYKVKYTDAWCATTVSAVSISLGYTAIIPTECGCNQMIQLFKTLGEWVENDAYVPSPGDVIFYDWQDSGTSDNTGSADHVGIVETVANGKITVIEGNYSDAVKRRTLNVNGRYIRGYGVPKYTVNTTPAKEKKTTSKKSNAQVAKEVLAGKWGNGQARKKALTAAGYNYLEVQSEVNRLLR